MVQNSKKLHVDEWQWWHVVKDCAAIDLDEFKARKEISNFESSGFRGVGAVGAIVADAGAEIVTDGAGAHEVGERAEEEALAMNGVETAGFLFGEAHGLDRDDFEAGFVDARK